jgi:LTXXQ motif family protein
MRRLVLIGMSVALASSAVATGAEARPRLPGILGAVIGTVGGIVGMRHYARAHHHAGHVAARHAPAGAAVTTVAAAPAGAREEIPRNPAAAGQIAVAGPLFWPSLSDDVFAYVLWPAENDRLWAYGYGDIVDGALRPADPNARRRPPPTTTGSATAAAGTDAAPACSHPQGTQTADALNERIEQTIQPTEAQRAALDELRAATQRALAYVDAACPAPRVPTPTARLDSMEDRLWAARQALMVLRAPLDKLYGALDDEQKARLNGPGPQRAAVCGQTSAQQPTALIEQRIRPNPDQRAALEAVKMTSAGLARMVASTCPAERPTTPLARLDAADKRLNTLLYAVVTLRAPVDGFYASLSDAQKTRLGGLSR